MKTLTKKILFTVLAVFLAVSCFAFATATFNKNIAKADATETATFTGPWGSTSFNSATALILQYSSTAAWDDADDGNLASHVYIDGELISAATGTIMHWGGQKWVRFHNLQGIKTGSSLEITDGATFGGVIIPAMTFYFNGEMWSKGVDYSSIVHNNINYTDTHAVSIEISPSRPSNGVYATIAFSESFGNSADTTNYATGSYSIGTGLKINGTSIKDISGAFVDSAHGGVNMSLYIPFTGFSEYKRATLTVDAGTEFKGKYLNAFTLYFNGSSWSTTPNNKTTVSYSSIVWNNNNYATSVFGGGTGGKGVLIQFSANLSSVSSEYNGGIQSVELKDIYGKYITLNGETLDNISGAELRYHSVGLLWIYTPDMTTWAGHIPTIEIAENAPFLDAYLPATTLYWNGTGAWGTSSSRRAVNYSTITWNNTNYLPAVFGGAGVLITFDANLSLIASEASGGIQSLELKSVYGSYITLNGETLDNIEDAELRYHSQGHLWIYAPNMTTWAGHIPTIEIAENTPFSYSYLPATTLYWSGSAWGTSNPIRAVGYSTITWNNIDYGVFGGAGVLITFDANLSLIASEVNGGIQSVELKSVYGSYITVNGETLDNIEDAELRYHSQGHLWIYAPNMTTWANHTPTIKIAASAPFSYSTLPAITLNFIGNQWKKVVEYSSIVHNNINYTDTHAVSIETGTPANGIYATLGFAESLGNSASATNLATDSYDIGTGLKINGVSIKDISGAFVDRVHGGVNLSVYVPFTGISEYKRAKLTIDAGTEVNGVYLSDVELYFKGSAWSTTPNTKTAVNYSTITWNNIGYGTFEGKTGVLITFDAYLSSVSSDYGGGLQSVNLVDKYGSYIIFHVIFFKNGKTYFFYLFNSQYPVFFVDKSVLL